VTIICRASAPGKVVLAGEYAVLDGAPAICAAIDRRAYATLSKTQGDVSRVKTPGFANDGAEFRVTDDGVEWLAESLAIDVVDSIWRAMENSQPAAAEIDLNTTAFVDKASGAKMGIGSSAAITVALCAAVKRTSDIAAIARRAHTSLQGGRGSGVDVACSLSGGLIQYRIEGASVTSLEWPDELKFRLIWTGVAVSTQSKLAQLDAGRNLPSRVRLTLAAEDMAIAWRDGDASNIIAGYRDYIEYLRVFGSEHDLGIFDAGHDRLWETANEMNMVYKPCGAGGGDIGVVFATDDDVLNQFVRKLAAPCKLLDCALDSGGIRIQGQEQEQR
jgi:phosphomevalonate kinase